MSVKVIGTGLGIVGLLSTAAHTLAREDVAKAKMRQQAARVISACDAVFRAAPQELVFTPKDGQVELKGSLARSADRVAKAFVRIAGKHLAKPEMYTPVFVGARVLACSHTINAMAYRHGLNRQWRMVEQTSYTLMKMLMCDLEDEEAKMGAIAMEFEMEVGV